MNSTSKIVGFSPVSLAVIPRQDAKTIEKTNTTANKPTTTNTSNAVASQSATSNYGSEHDQNIGVKVYENLASVPNLKKAELKNTTTGGLHIETLQDAYDKLMAINSTANLSADQKALLEAFTNAWLFQHPEDGIKQGNALANAKKVATIFKKLIIDNYVNANIATLDQTNALQGLAWPSPARYKQFFKQKPTIQEINKKKEDIGTPINPIAGLSPTTNIGFAQIQRTK